MLRQQAANRVKGARCRSDALQGDVQLDLVPWALGIGLLVAPAPASGGPHMVCSVVHRGRFRTEAFGAVTGLSGRTLYQIDYNPNNGRGVIRC
jgi:hypothetical protein